MPAQSKTWRIWFVALLALISVFSFQFSAFSQSYAIDWDTVGGSGGASSGGQFAVSDTTGQPAVGDPLTGGNAAYDDGFWSLFYIVPSIPIAQPMTVYRTAGLTLKIALSDVATNWSDANGEPVSLAGINLVTTNHVNLMTNSSYIFYTNSPNVDDQIAYGIADDLGATNTGVINIVIVPSVTGQVTGIIAVNAGSATVGFAGIPDYQYSVERSTNLVDWVAIWTTNAPAGGLFNYTDTFSDLSGAPPPAAYYRLSWTP
ncbi:MAG TPA: hypothetical protein VFY06_14960 [Verrucomicrobiae bacterium]|nr:hypothetical protein [Verrucomicrobiae bacterium]